MSTQTELTVEAEMQIEFGRRGWEDSVVRYKDFTPVEQISVISSGSNKGNDALETVIREYKNSKMWPDSATRYMDLAIKALAELRTTESRSEAVASARRHLKQDDLTWEQLLDLVWSDRERILQFFRDNRAAYGQWFAGMEWMQ